MTGAPVLLMTLEPTAPVWAEVADALLYPLAVTLTFTEIFLPTRDEPSVYVEDVAPEMFEPFDNHWYL